MPDRPQYLKATHAEVRYSPGTKAERCGVCRHFLPPDGCESVKRPIAADAWCIRFERTRKAA